MGNAAVLDHVFTSKRAFTTNLLKSSRLEQPRTLLAIPSISKPSKVLRSPSSSLIGSWGKTSIARILHDSNNIIAISKRVRRQALPSKPVASESVIRVTSSSLPSSPTSQKT